MPEVLTAEFTFQPSRLWSCILYVAAFGVVLFLYFLPLHLPVILLLLSMLLLALINAIRNKQLIEGFNHLSSREDQWRLKNAETGESLVIFKVAYITRWLIVFKANPLDIRKKPSNFPGSGNLRIPVFVDALSRTDFQHLKLLAFNGAF